METQTNVPQVSSALNRQNKLEYIKLQDWLVNFLKYGFLIFLTLSFMLPLYWMGSSAIKSDSQVYTVPPIWFPIPAHWENFYNAWTSYNFNLWGF